MEPRRARYRDGTILQQSMALNQDAMAIEGNMPPHVLGVVLEVRASDHRSNRTAFQRSDYRGFLHEASVLILMDGTDSMFRLDNVVICPDHVTGLDHYHEQLPRGSSQTVTGEPYNGRLHGINPYDLDGDWCVVSFLGGSIRHPFISRWWPHARNTYDPLTSGQGSPDDSGDPKALDQGSRYFRRVNGIEQVITPRGDVYFSTRWAGSQIQHASVPTEGRYAREEVEDGGTVSVNVKPTQRLLVDFNEEVEGLHHLSGFDDSLPQGNPRQRQQPERRASTRTRLITTGSAFRLSTSRVAATATESVTIEADDEITLTSGNTFDVDSEETVTIQAGETFSVEAPEILLGTEEPEYLIRGETYDNNTALVLLTYQLQIETAISSIRSATTTTNLAARVADGLDLLWTVLTRLQEQIPDSFTNKTKAE